MKRILILCGALLALAGCVSQSDARRQAQTAFLAGRQAESEANAAKLREPSVVIRGNVKNRVIPWNENLTLARAILDAVDQNLTDPKKFLLTRGNRTMEITPRQLLDGYDIPLEAGDTVFIMH
jgi:hypothetical protein